MPKQPYVPTWKLGAPLPRVFKPRARRQPKITVGEFCEALYALADCTARFERYLATWEEIDEAQDQFQIAMKRLR